MIKKNMTTLHYQQKQWIEHAYADIKEDPMSFGIKDVISDKDKIAILIQEDTEAQFGCRVSVRDIENILNKESRGIKRCGK